MKKLLQMLTETPGPSGHEDEVRKIVRAEVEPLADNVTVDTRGNLIARKHPAKRAGNTKKIMIAAHMDETGVIASHVDRNGFIRFAPVGGVPRRYLPGGRVRFMNGTQGIIGFDSWDRVNELPALDKLYIDVGATSPDDSPVNVGEVAVFDYRYSDLGNRLVAKSMDNRVGVLVAIETLRSLKATPHDLYVVFTTQEAAGISGVGTSAFGIDPDLGLALDVSPADDTPHSGRTQIALGKGPCVKIQGAEMVSDARLVQWIIEVAEKNKIPYQREVLPFGGSEAGAIQLTRAGVPAGSLSVPVRFVHSPSEMVDVSDVHYAVKLLTALLRTPIDL